MLINYFKIGLRALLRKRAYSAINILGLAIGMAASILILLWVYDELTFDSNFSKYELIHQVKLNVNYGDKIQTRPSVPLPLKDVILQQDSRIAKYTLTTRQPALLSVGEKKLSKTGIDASDAFLEIFDFKMLYGNRASVLSDPRSIVLSKSTAAALFGSEDPINKIVHVKFEQSAEFIVTGVVDDFPTNTSFNFDFILPFSYFEKYNSVIQYTHDNWFNYAFQMYVELQPGVKKEEVDLAIRDLITANSGEKNRATIFLHPMTRWRLHNNFENGEESGGLIEYVNLFSGIAILILVMACINFMNLSTARAEHRAREVGIRKSVGSSRKQLIAQFIGESLLTCVIAFLISIVLVELVLPFYNDLIGKHLVPDYTSPVFLLFSLLFVTITSVLAGSYPAFYLSSFKAIHVLKSRVHVGKQAGTPRQIMVGLQFGFSIFLIVGTLIIYKQIQFLKSRDIGYDQENLIMLNSTSDIENNFRALKNELLASSAVQSVCKSSSPITNIYSSSPIDSWKGSVAGEQLDAVLVATEYDYTSTMGVKLLEGRDFSEDFKSDTAAILINKKALEAFDFTNPIGEKIQMWDQWWHVIGVMDDILMGSSSKQIQPMVLIMDSTWSTTINLRLSKTNDLDIALKKVEGILKKYNPDYPFEYQFADKEFERKFTSINMVSSLSSSFAILAVIIASLGLFGMAAFSAEQRIKEIGIRKIVGASVLNLVVLLVQDFIKVVFIAFVISCPFVWWAVNEFLQQYQMRIDPPMWVFTLAGVISMVITTVIVGSLALRAATQNPVESLTAD